MRSELWVAVTLLTAVCASGAQDLQPRQPATQPFGPVKLSLAPEPESVYAQPEPPSEKDLFNAGGVNLDFKVSYLNEYVFRGLNRANLGNAAEAPNLQFDGMVMMNLGRIPHPFIGVFVNVFNSDPVSRFQEIRPYFGVEWKLRPLILGAGHNTYIYPDRDNLNTSEVWGRVTLMDDAIFRIAEPIFSPYVFGAYDYDKYNGWYLEAGVKHDFVIGKTGLTLTLEGLVSYIRGVELFTGPTGKDTGFQRYQVGLTGRYSLNQLLNIPRRYGQWSLNGYLYYTDGVTNKLRTDTGLWGGGGIEFVY